VDVSINIGDDPDPENFYRRFEEGTQLSDAEVGVLVRSGKLDEEVFKELQAFMGFSGVYAGGKRYSEQYPVENCCQLVAYSFSFESLN
jgi:hypothetical protein